MIYFNFGAITLANKNFYSYFCASIGNDGNPNGLFPFQEHVPVFHNVLIPYVHQLQNVLHEHNENISIHMQIFNI